LDKSADTEGLSKQRPFRYAQAHIVEGPEGATGIARSANRNARVSGKVKLEASDSIEFSRELAPSAHTAFGFAET